MNRNFNQTEGQVAHKSYPFCVVRTTDIVMEAYNNSHWLNLSTGQITKNVASPLENEPVIGLEDRLLLTRWSVYFKVCDIRLKKKKLYVSKLPRVCLFFGARLIQQNSNFQYFLLAYFFPPFLMNFLVKIYMKRHDRQNKTLWTTDFFNSVFCLVSCSSKNQVPYFILNKVVTDSNLTCLLLRKKNKKTKTKTHLGQVFQSVTSFETWNFFFLAL